jgi:hypothetical protein
MKHYVATQEARKQIVVKRSFMEMLGWANVLAIGAVMDSFMYET